MPTDIDNDLPALPAALVEAVRSQRAILFLGAGASAEAVGPGGRTTPTSSELRDTLAQKFFHKAMPQHDLMMVAEMAIGAWGQAAVFEAIRGLLDPFQPSPAHLLVPHFRWRTIATTNFDLLLERAYEARPDSLQTLIPFVKDSEPIEDKLSQALNPVEYLKLHGCLNHIHDINVPPVLSHEHYSRYERNRQRLFGRLQDRAQESPVIFCGYRLHDPHIRNLIYKLEPPDRSRPSFYLVSPHIDEDARSLYATLNVHVVPATFGNFMHALDRGIPVISRSLKVHDTVQELPIRRHYRTTARETALVRDALSCDLMHIRNDMPYTPQGPDEFYRGYDNGWGAIIQRLDAHRRISEELLHKALFDNTYQRSQHLFVIKGPAGAGKTIVLKRTAWDAATSLDAVVLWLETGGTIKPDVILEVAELTGKRIYIFVDRLSMNTDNVSHVLRTAKERGKPLTIIGAERDLDWNTYCLSLDEKWSPVEARISHLSTGEIEGLLDLLERHGSLGILAGQSRSEQIDAFMNRADRQLLVALHEATRGKRFEDIIYEEFTSIAPEQARLLYLDIATMHQFGVPARAGTISRISRIRFRDFEREFFKPLENVVLVSHNPTTNDYQYETRHARVATLVFQQACPEGEARANQLIRILRGLDIGYTSDQRVLLDIVRGRNLSKKMPSVAAGREVYRTATEIAPQEGFVLQQWAIFEFVHPEGSLQEAERIANRARDLDPRSQSIIHTQAEIARKCAISAPSSIAKDQFRVQTRARLSELRDTNSRFAYSTRLKLLVDEISDLSAAIGDNPREKDVIFLGEKIKSAELVLLKAEQVFADDTDLLETEARLRRALSQHTRAQQALERAWKAGHRGIGVPIRLADVYLLQGDAARARGILEETLAQDADSTELHYRMADFLLKNYPSEQRLIVDHLAAAYTRNDGRYEARYLHAQCLFWVGHLEDCATLFSDIDARAPAKFKESPRVVETPVTRLLPRYSGTICRVEMTFALVKSPAYIHELFSRDRFSPPETWDRLRFGLEVNFKIAFHRSGPIAVDLRPGRLPISVAESQRAAPQS